MAGQRQGIHLLVRHVDRSIGLLGIVISQDPRVVECPAKDIVHDQDSGILVGSRDISVVAGEFCLGARGLSTPVEASFAALHFVNQLISCLCESRGRCDV